MGEYSDYLLVSLFHLVEQYPSRSHTLPPPEKKLIGGMAMGRLVEQ